MLLRKISLEQEWKEKIRAGKPIKRLKQEDLSGPEACGSSGGGGNRGQMRKLLRRSIRVIGKLYF